MSERESPRPLDPRLEGIRGALARRIANDALAPQLVRSGLIDEEKDILVSPLTEEGLEMLLKSLVYGVEMVLWNTQLPSRLMRRSMNYPWWSGWLPA